MIVVMKSNYTPEQMQAAVRVMEEGGVRVMISKGSETTILGAEGNAAGIDQNRLSLLPGVERVMRVSEPFKMANRKYHPDDTVIELPGGRSVGGNRLAVFAGPCSVEGREQIVDIAERVRRAGACALRGGAWQLAGFLLLWALAFAFVFFTYRPIHLPLWQDPTNGLYGLAAARAAG